MKDHSPVRCVSLVGDVKVGEAPDRPYLSLYRIDLRNTYEDGTLSDVYSYDAVLRKWLDAVTLILSGTVDQQLCVCLRACVRPPLTLRNRAPIPFPEEEPPHFLWELPAGLIEGGDLGDDGIRRRAAAEAIEETGYEIPPDDLILLRGAPFLSPGVLPERIWFVTGTVKDPAKRVAAPGDGSVVERGGRIKWVPLKKAVEMCDDGRIEDMKTEVGLRRLAATVRM